MISYSEALFDWVEDHWDDLQQEYKVKFGSLPTEDDEASWQSFCQRSFDDQMSMVEDHPHDADR